MATEILPRDMNGKFYDMEQVNADVDILCHDSANDYLTCEKYSKLSKQHFYNRTSLPVTKFEDDLEDDVNDHYKLPYSIPYRRMFSMHFYQAPELRVP